MGLEGGEGGNRTWLRPTAPLSLPPQPFRIPVVNGASRERARFLSHCTSKVTEPSFLPGIGSTGYDLGLPLAAQRAQSLFFD